MFVNFSNHNSSKWSEDQYNAAIKDGIVVDVPFPEVEAYESDKYIMELAEEYLIKLVYGPWDTKDKFTQGLTLKPTTILVQGEFTLAFTVIRLLQKNYPNIRVVAACSERVVQEVQLPDDTTQKVSTFKFIRFREYPHI